jgi:hypothetical protein
MPTDIATRQFLTSECKLWDANECVIHIAASMAVEVSLNSVEDSDKCLRVLHIIYCLITTAARRELVML